MFTECLDQLGSLIENYGVSVCQPSPSAALKEVAKQIADRDNSVRNAALNCIVQAYFLQGERIFKLIGQVHNRNFINIKISNRAKYSNIILFKYYIAIDFGERQVFIGRAYKESSKKSAHKIRVYYSTLYTYCCSFQSANR
jgi:uncharacterized protein YutD